MGGGISIAKRGGTINLPVEGAGDVPGKRKVLFENKVGIFLDKRKEGKFDERRSETKESDPGEEDKAAPLPGGGVFLGLFRRSHRRENQRGKREERLVRRKR